MIQKEPVNFNPCQRVLFFPLLASLNNLLIPCKNVQKPFAITALPRYYVKLCFNTLFPP
jgi:hypothetical protein